MMLKKIIASVALVATVAVSAAMFAAFEAHVINVTAKIENALSVTPDEIMFGTVFPQEQLDRNLVIALSESFIEEGRVDDVNYVIKQKPKPRPEMVDICFDGMVDHARHWCYEHEETDVLYCGDGEDLFFSYYDVCYYNLCPYLSKHPDCYPDCYPDCDCNDESLDAFHPMRENSNVNGRLAKSEDDVIDEWVIDLKVPCFHGSCGQDYFDWVNDINGGVDPHDYMLDPELEHEMFGCDLWIEVVGVSVNYIDAVDVGDLNSEASHSLVGWGPIEPDTHGGGWGGFGPTQPYAGDCRVTYASEANGDGTTDASLTLDFGPIPVTGSRYLVLDHLDGQALSDDFDVYLNGNKVAYYTGDPSTAEIWKTSYVEIPEEYPSIIEVTLDSTNDQWDLWETYGQVAFDVIKSTNAPEGSMLNLY